MCESTTFVCRYPKYLCLVSEEGIVQHSVQILDETLVRFMLMAGVGIRDGINLAVEAHDLESEGSVETVALRKIVALCTGIPT